MDVVSRKGFYNRLRIGYRVYEGQISCSEKQKDYREVDTLRAESNAESTKKMPSRNIGHTEYCSMYPWRIKTARNNKDKAPLEIVVVKRTRDTH